MLEKWEGLEPRTQVLVAFPVLGVVTFLANLFLFSQPLVRSVVYGVIEGALFTAFAVIATRNEIARRKRDDQ